MVTEIFISYTWSKDLQKQVEKFSEKLKKSLVDRNKKRQISIFYDKLNITEGSEEEEFRPILQSHLNSSKIMLVLLSPAWLESKWCNWEFATFNISNRPIIAILWYNIDSIKISSSEIREKLIHNDHIIYVNKSDEEYKLLVNKISEYV